MAVSARIIEMRGVATSGSGAASSDAVPDQPVLFVGATPWWETSGLVRSLRDAGWGWISAPDPSRARWLASIQKVSLVVVGGDRSLRWTTVDEVRSVTGVPIVVLAEDSSEVVPLIDAGVDAVLDPSDRPAENFARLVALLRRADHRWGPGVRYLVAGELSVDVWTQQCTLNGVPLQLSPTEYALLTFLMTRPDVALSTAVIVRRVWGWLPSDGKNALRIIVNRLRRKLDDDPREPRFVASVRGIGYRFVANVTEVADAAEHHAERVDVTPLLDAVAVLAESLQHADTVARMGELLLDALERSGHADGMAVFRLDGSTMRLLAARHMSAAWTDRVQHGVPLDPSFASARSVLSGETVQIADVRSTSGHFTATARQLADDDYRACHFVPITCRGEAWGHLGMVRRSCQPLDAVAMSFLRSLCGAFSLGLAGAHDAEPAGR